MAEAAAIAEPIPTIAEILADMLAYQREEFEPKPLAYTVWSADEPPRCLGTFNTEDAAQILIDATPGAEMGLDMPDLDVSGADLVDAFSAWRDQIKAALAHPSPAPLGRIIFALEAGSALLDASIEDQASGVADGLYEDDPEIDAKHEELEKLFADTILDAKVMGTMPREIFVTMEGGVIIGQFCAHPTPDLTFSVIDYDCEGAERGHALTHMVAQSSPQPHSEAPEIDGRFWSAAYVARGQEIEHQPAPDIAPAAEPRFDAAWEE